MSEHDEHGTPDEQRPEGEARERREPLSPAERRRLKNELTHREIRRNLEGLSGKLLEQAARMDALDRGEPDPYPERDAEAAAEIADEIMRQQTDGETGEQRPEGEQTEGEERL